MSTVQSASACICLDWAVTFEFESIHIPSENHSSQVHRLWLCFTDRAGLCAVLLLVKDECQLQADGATSSVEETNEISEGRFYSSFGRVCSRVVLEIGWYHCSHFYMSSCWQLAAEGPEGFRAACVVIHVSVCVWWFSKSLWTRCLTNVCEFRHIYSSGAVGDRGLLVTFWGQKFKGGSVVHVREGEQDSFNC